MSHWFGLKWFRKPNVIWTRKQIGAAHFVKLYFFFVIQYCCFPFWSIGFVMLSYVNSFFFFLFAHHEIGHDIVHIIVETLVRRIAVSCVFHVIKICFDSFSRIESAIKCNHFHFYRTNVIVTLLTNAETRAKKKKKIILIWLETRETDIQILSLRNVFINYSCEMLLFFFW